MGSNPEESRVALHLQEPDLLVAALFADSARWVGFSVTVEHKQSMARYARSLGEDDLRHRRAFRCPLDLCGQLSMSTTIPSECTPSQKNDTTTHNVASQGYAVQLGVVPDPDRLWVPSFL